MTQVVLQRLVAHLEPSLREALESAAGAALRSGAEAIEIEHWLLELCNLADENLVEFLSRQKVDTGELKRELEGRISRYAVSENRQPTLSGEVVQLLQDSWLLASINFSDSMINTLHLVLAVLHAEVLGIKTTRLKSFASVSVEGLQNQLKLVSASKGANLPVTDGITTDDIAGGLSKYSVNLTEEARQQRLPPIVGRTGEIRQLVDILARKGRNNPIIVGEPGVGKTAVVEALAQRIVSGKVPKILEGVEIYSLDLGLLEAGASVKGEFERRLKDVINEVKNSETPIIVFIDEAHLLIGDATGGRMDAANLLKPALARGEFRTIAATTWAEYKRHIEKDPALTRRFDVVKVGEPTVEDTLQILRGAVPNLEKHHEVVVSDDAIDAAVDLTVRYLPERRLPDKALGILDTACARVAIAQDMAPRSLEQAEDLVAYLDAQRLALERDGARVLDVDEKKKSLSAEVVGAVKTVKKLRKQWDAEKGIVGELNALFGVASDRSKAPVKTQTVLKLRQDLDALQTDGSMISEMVDRQAIAEIISEWTGVPAGKVVDTEAAQLENLEGAMAARVVGQRAAISSISERIRMSRAGLHDERKPIGVFLLCGPSGVGKTETALALTEKLFGSEQNITTINMSEFKEEHKVSMLLGAPAGYVGYGEGGVLTEAVRRQPYSVLLLDEFEKAHPGVHDIFYQIFDKGTARDSEGRDVDFRNTVIVMTSNAGDSVVSAFAETHGPDADYKEVVDVVRPELLHFFKPAFLGRLDIVPYFPLSREELVSIGQLAMARIRRQIEQRYGASFEYTEKCLEDLVDEYHDPNLGGRAVEQALAQRLLPDLARECLSRLAAGEPISRIKVRQGKTGKELELTVQ